MGSSPRLAWCYNPNLRDHPDHSASLLPADFDEAVTEIEDDLFHIQLSTSQVEELADRFGWSWTPSGSRARLEALAAKYPAGSVTSSQVKESIDKAALSLSRTKRVSGISMFADIDGFTGYIDGLEQIDEDLVEAIRTFHVIRGVMRDSAVQDYDALRIQYQGDRMQALVYQPVTDSARTALAAVRLAAALITVSKDVVPSAVASGQVHDLAIGLAYGEVLISRIGEHGNTDVVSIGQSTADAAKIQQRLDGGCIGISTGMRDLLPDWLKDAFKWSVSAKAYVARGLDWDDLKTLEEQSEQTDRSTASYRRAASVRPWAAR